jgi:DNA-binding NarL/FixJ family response regulator
MGAIRILLVDDHEIVRFGLRTAFEAEPDLAVVAEAGDGEQAVRAARAHQPNVVVLDIRMGAMDGIEACRQIRGVAPGAAILMLTSVATDEAVLQALMAGASGFLLKNTARAELLRAVRLLAAGESLLDPAVTRRVTEKLVSLANSQQPTELAALSAREREVLALVAQGRSNREIADALVISETTARNHVSHILEKLGLHRRGEAAALAARLGLLDPGP